MKKHYITMMMALLLSITSYSQAPLITSVVDACGTDGKFVELYVSGTVDFADYKLVRRSNSGTWADNGVDVDISALGTRTDEFVYICRNITTLGTEFPNAGISSSNAIENSGVSHNGNDSWRLVEIAGNVVIDEFGGEDGSINPLPWDYEDSWVSRNNGEGPTPTFTFSEWTFGIINELDNVGLCNDPANPTLETVASSVGTYTPSASVTSPTSPSPTPTQNQADVVSVFSDEYTGNTDFFTTTFGVPANNSTGEFETFASNEVLKVIYDGGDFIGLEFDDAIDASTMENFHIDVWIANPIPVGAVLTFKWSNHAGGHLTGETDSFISTQIISDGENGQWLSFDIPLDAVGFPGQTGSGTDAKSILSQLVINAASADGTYGPFYFDNFYFWKDSAPAVTAPSVSAPVPTEDSANVVSIYSDAYTDLPIANFDPNWGQSGHTLVNTTFDPTGGGTDFALAYPNFNYQGTDFGSSEDLSDMDFLHVDIWVAPGTDRIVKVSPINNGTGAGEFLVEVPVTPGSWNSVTLDKADFTGMTWDSVFQLKFDGQFNSDGSANTTPFDIYLDNIYFSQIPSGPANDDCDNAIALTVNTDDSCSSVTSGTNVDSTASSQADDVTGTPDNDVWFSFVATNTNHEISLSNIQAVVGTSTDMGMGLYDGTAGCASLAFVDDSDPNSFTATGLTIGSTYYLRVYGWYALSSASYSETTFDVCVGTPPPPPANDDCSGALPLNITTDNTTFTSFSTTFATEGAFEIVDCDAFGNLGVWYTFTAPATSLEFLQGASGNPGITIFEGPDCNNLTELTANCLNNSSGSISGLTVGNDYYAMVWTDSSQATAEFVLYFVTCPEPTALSAQNITEATADLSWTAGDVETEWEILWGPSGFDPATEGTLINDNDGSLGESLTGLTENTSYDFYVTAVCATDSSSNQAGPFTFTTACAPFAINVEEDFSSLNFNVNTSLNCWAEGSGIFTPEGSSGWGSQTFNNDSTNDNDNGTSLYVNLYNSGGQTNEFVTTPIIDLGAGDPNMVLSYDVFVKPWSGTSQVTDMGLHSVSVVISTDAGATWDLVANTLMTYDTSNIPNDLANTLETISLAGYSGQVQIGFLTDEEGTATDLRFYIDNFFVGLPPTGLVCDLALPATVTPFGDTSQPINIDTDGLSDMDSVPSCEGFDSTEQGLWYEFTTNATDGVVLSLLSGSVTGIEGAIYDSCGGIELFCFADGGSADFNNDVLVTGLTANTSYIIQVYSESFNSGVYSLAITDLPTCIDPQNLVATGISSDSATLNWDVVSNATNGYNWSVYTSPSDPSTDTPIATGSTAAGVNSDVVTGLMPQTDYDFYVEADCDTDGTSVLAGSVSFTTGCAPAGLNYSENFTGLTFDVDASLTCWNEGTGLFDNQTGGSWGGQTFNNDAANDNGNGTALYINLYNSGTGVANDWVTSQQVDLGAGSPDYVLTYDAYVIPWFGTDQVTDMGTHSVRVVISTDGGVTWDLATNTLATYDSSNIPNDINNTFESVSLAGYSGVVQIGFLAQRETTTPDLRFYIDNIYVGTPPTCDEPTLLNVSGVTFDSAQLNWTGNAGATNGYIWSVFTSPSDPSNDTPVATGTVAAGVDTATVTGLSSETTYDFYVVSDCDTDGLSVSAGPVTFTTLCAPATLDYQEDFTGLTFDANASLSCWNEGTGLFDTTGTGAWGGQNFANDAANPNGTAMYINLYNISAGVATDWVTSQLIDLGAGSPDYVLSYDTYVIPWSGTAQVTDMGTHTVRAVISNDGGATWDLAANTLATYDSSNIPNDINNTLETISLAGYSGVVQIGFIAERETTNPDLRFYVDNIFVGTGPICPDPTGLNVTNITTDSADLNWNDVVEATNGYNWSVFTSPGDPSVDTPVASGTTAAGMTMAQVTGLTSGTTYDFYLEADCDTNGTSVLVGPVSFSTNPDYCAGDLFYDNGGPGANYANGSNETITISPSNAGDIVAVEFLAFNTELNYDGIQIYDGPDTTAPLIDSGFVNPGFGPLSDGTWTGTPTDATSAEGQIFTSTHPTGSLTFVFTSDGSVDAPGWEAVVTCNPPEILDYYNLQFPAAGSIFTGNSFFVFAQAYEAGLTDTSATPAAGIETWIGYSTIDSSPNTDADWTWVSATTNPGFDYNQNNDEYMLDLGAEITAPGTYYYASRWRLNNGPFTYGGILPDASNGGEWGTNGFASGVLTISDCLADAGTLTADATSVPLVGGIAIISATEDVAPTVPAVYQTLYVLTSGTDLVIEQTSSTPSFDVTAVGVYTIHTLVYDPATLDLSIVVPGTTTGFDVNALLIQGGGDICASLDVAGAPITVLEECLADAGTLIANGSPVELSGGTATISATEDVAPTVPAGYQTLYVLTSGTDLVIEQTSATPSFDVTDARDYTIHTLVYDPATLDLSIVVPGTTTGFDVNALLIQGGGTICASLDVIGAPVTVLDECLADAGTLTIDSNPVQLNGGIATVSATEDVAPTVPAGYQTLYVLTSGTGLVIEQTNATPSFDVTDAGDYTIHTLVYDPATLDLSIVVPGTTTGFDVNALLIQGGGTICASLDVIGAPVTVLDECLADAGTLTIDANPVQLNGGIATVSATEDVTPTVPAGYQTLYVLTSGTGLVIEQTSATPSFDVTDAGDYTIHTLVYDPATLDLSIVVPGTTTGFDVNALLIQGGGTICASLDVAGAPVTVQTMGLDDAEFIGFGFYPNPVSHTLNLQTENQVEEIEIFNVLGQGVMKETPNIVSPSINVEALQSGTYLMNVSINGVTKNFKFIKE